MNNEEKIAQLMNAILLFMKAMYLKFNQNSRPANAPWAITTF